MSYSPSDFQVGDIVRVRQWDDMKEEFGGDEDDYEIFMPDLFVYTMSSYCGEEHEITHIGQAKLVDMDGRFYELSRISLSGICDYIWNTLMIEPVHTKTLFNMDDFTTMLGG